jgi:hypothetical protein
VARGVDAAAADPTMDTLLAAKAAFKRAIQVRDLARSTHAAAQQEVEQLRALVEGQQEHFMISSGDMSMPDRDIPQDVKDRYWSAAYGIIDELRAADDLEQAPEIIDVLIGLDFEHEWQRAAAMQKIIDDLSRDVTPRVARALAHRDQRVMALMRRDSNEWWRRRGKIEPIAPSPKQSERAIQLEEREDDRNPDG